LWADREPVPNLVATIRTVAVKVAEEFIRECPHVVRGTFTGLGG
jgi:hypothetical protein